MSLLRSRIFAALLLSMISTGACHPVLSQDCSSRDCNKDCCTSVDLGMLGRHETCEPICKGTCKSQKRLCKSVGIPIPTSILPPNPLVEINKLLKQSCAGGFEAVTKYVMFNRGLYSYNSGILLERAKTQLISCGLYSQHELDRGRYRMVQIKVWRRNDGRP